MPTNESTTLIPVATVPPQLEPFAREMARTYSNDVWPEDEVYSVMADALRMNARTAKTFNDASCVELSISELEGDGRRKLIEMFNGRPAVPGREAKAPILTRFTDRKQLFKFLATALNNHARGLVHRHRFTAKRTGSKVPPKGSPELEKWNRERQKPEVSLDAIPEIRSRLEFQAAVPSADAAEADDDMADVLTPTQFLVYQQFAHPNQASLLLASLDAKRGRSRNPGEVVIKAEHLAEGVGLTTAEFEEAALGVRAKFEAYQRGEALAEAPRLPAAPPSKRERLSPAEFLVYQQLVCPGQVAKALAAASRSPVLTEHLAAAVGMPPEAFRRLAEAVKSKLMDNSNQQPAAIDALETVFQVQVPRSLPSLIVRRLFTLAARAQFEKVTDEVASMLASIGAEVPQVNSQGNLTCFGVLFSRNHPVCSACQARTACSTKAANFGLDQVTISPALLSARASVRTAELVGSDPAPAASSAPASEREEGIRSYLEQHFQPARCFREQYYRHRALPSDNRQRQIVWVGSKPEASQPGINSGFMVRFCNASPEMQKKLVRWRSGYYLPDNLPVKQACELIADHANHLFSAPAAAVAPKQATVPAPKAAASKAAHKPVQKIATTLGQVCNLIGSRARHLWVDLIDGLVVRPVHPKK